MIEKKLKIQYTNKADMLKISGFIIEQINA